MPSKSASDVASAHLNSTREKSRRIARLTSPSAEKETTKNAKSPTQEKETTKNAKSPTTAKALVKVFPSEDIEKAARTSNDNGTDVYPQKDAKNKVKDNNDLLKRTPKTRPWKTKARIKASLLPPSGGLKKVSCHAI